VTVNELAEAINKSFFPILFLVVTLGAFVLIGLEKFGYIVLSESEHGKTMGLIQVIILAAVGKVTGKEETPDE